MTNRKIKSREASVENVRRIFANTPNKDSIKLKEAFVAWERPNPDNIDKNKAWLSNMLYHLKYHNLLTPIYSYNKGRKTLDSLKLTLEGKKALGRIKNYEETKNGDPHDEQKFNTPSFIDVMKIVAKLREDNPDYAITFDVKLKNEVV